jgi:hypothetical protein
MLLSLAQWLQTLSPEFGFFRVFQYLTFPRGDGGHDGAADRLIAGPFVIRRLTELKIGQPCVATAWRPTWQKRHAHHGRRADPAVHRHLDAAVV